MKNNIVFKFIAILLCAACLMGAVGSAAGLIVLSSGNLFNRSVDQMLAELDESNGYSYAYNLAMRYASVNLGGCAEQLADNHFGRTSWFESVYQYDHYGYRLLDADGNVLDSLNPELKDSAAVTYDYSITGQYMHQISATPESERYSVPETLPIDSWSSDGNTILTDAIPPEGTDFYYLNFGDSSGSTGIGSDEPMGFVYYSNDGRVFFRTYDAHHSLLDYSPMALYSISLMDANHNVIYQASSDSPLGLLNYDDQSRLYYESYLLEETGQSDISAFYELSFRNPENEEVYWLRSDDNHSLGTSYYDENGHFRFTIDMSSLQSYSESGSKPDSQSLVYGLILHDHDGTPLYDAFSRDGLGFVVYNDSSHSTLIYRSNYPEISTASESSPAIAAVPMEETAPMTTAPEETMAEETTAEETKAETQSEDTTPTMAEEVDETTAETTAETVPEETEAEEAAALSEDAGESTEPTMAEETTGEGETTDSTEAAEATEETIPPTTEAAAETVPPTIPEETVPLTEPTLINGKPLSEYGIDTESYWDSTAGERMIAEYIRLPMPEYTVELYLAEGARRNEAAYDVLRIVHHFRSYLFPALGISLLLFAVFLVYLFCAAGRKPKVTEVRAGALNRIPLDLYLGGGAFAVTGLVIALAEGGNFLLRQDILTGCVFGIAMAYLACLIVVGFLFAFAAQVKTPGGFWYSNTLCGRCLRLCFHFCLWLEKNAESRLLPAFLRLCKWCWSLIKKCCLFLYALAVSCCKWIAGAFNRFISLLPLTWQWLLAGFVLILVLVICIDGFKDGNDISLPLGLLFAFGLIFYGSHCFGTLLDTSKRMSKGDLDSKVDDKLMAGSFQDFADSLNDLAGVAVVAAQKQLKSERMKTELITNVSHDIKTPLTSIINYVDLLQKPHTDEEQEIYLEVLARQSQQLKKLIEDLMDMSKASTGNMAVEITKVDAVESINQALGEFADKLDKVQLTPVFRHTEESVAMMADGRLVWRVLGNLLSNAVKYALPGTRLYIDLMELEGKVVISLKNISREELNIDADELMERFVRGDDSRNTEGSGLGLNIAKSLMELQKGQLQLLVDGDLFKVTLIFPGA